MERLENSFER